MRRRLTGTNVNQKFNYKIMFKNKLSIISILIIVCVVSVLAVMAIYFSKTVKNTALPEVTEKDALLSDNKNNINEAQNQAARTVNPINQDDHVWGNPKATVQLIIYSDFQCPACLLYNDTIEQVKKEFKNDILVAYRHYPLRMHEQAIPAALASECASEQGKFWEMHDLLFANNQAQRMSIEQYEQDAADLGLDRVKFNQCLETEKYKDKVTAQMLGGKNYGVTGTPASFLNGRVLPGAYPFEDFTDSQGINRKGLKSEILKELGTK